MVNGKQDRDKIASSAIGIVSAEERNAYIVQECGDAAELKWQVEQRVAAHFQAIGQQEPSGLPDNGSPPPEHAQDQAGASREEGGDHSITQIGPYRVLKPIGEGVAGIVFQAEQKEPGDVAVSATTVAEARPQKPTRIMVALKVIKDGLDWRQIVARFEAERQALSMTDHPNIAKALGGGTGQSGQPYFVTEWVEGVPITGYCDDHHLTPRQRLELFIPVCQAVQYAHQKGVIHGDLKPSNVLVASQDGKPVPKLLDFGVAKATRRRPVESTSAADPDELGGKPEYMSPDQADTRAMDLDTRTDIYGLGLLLYELLTGTTPLTQRRLKNLSIAETLRLIREDETPAPSTRLAESKDDLASASVKRSIKPAALIEEVSGELDSLVMRALQKDRTRRYATANGLERDLQRYLAGESLEGCPSRTTHDLWRMAREHRLAFGAAAVMISLLLAATLAASGLAMWAFNKEVQAGKVERAAIEKQKHAQGVAAEYKDKFHQAETAWRSVVKELQHANAAEKAVRRSEEDSRAILGFLEKKLLLAGRSGDGSLAEAFWAEGKGKDVTMRKAVDAAEPQVADAFADRPLAEASIREILGLTNLHLGDAARAVKQYERALALRESILGVNDPDTAACRNKLAVAYRLASRTGDAGHLFDHNLNSLAHASALAARGSMLLFEKRTDEAELKLRACLTIRQKLQPDDWRTFDTMSTLGEALLDQKKYPDAESLLLSGYEGMKQREGAISSQDKPGLTKALQRLVKLYDAWGKVDKASKWRKELETAGAMKQS